MSKLSFRARALDASKQMPVFRAEEIPDLPDFAAINRAVPQMPTGMEKEEECEHHLQRAMTAQQAYGHTGELVIPTPEVFPAPAHYYNELYPNAYKLPRQLIHVQPFAIESDIPEYDMDSDDDAWLMQQEGVDITPLKFEEIIERLEKSSGQHVVTLNEAKLLLKENEDIIIAIYDYWLNKRLTTQAPLIHTVKTERRDGTTNNNPYVAFRRRTEKMQTRKNRKNDEASYEKMLKLRRDLSRAVNILEFVRHRESTKRDHLKLTIDILEKRYEIGDYSGQILADIEALRQKQKAAQQQAALLANGSQFYGKDKIRYKTDADGMPVPKKRREYKRRPKNNDAQRSAEKSRLSYASSDDESVSQAAAAKSDHEEEDPDGPYAFRRKEGCSYHAALTEQFGNWPWEPPSEGGVGDRRYRYCMTSISHPRPRFLGFARRRIGRGGRIIFDRCTWSQDDSADDLSSLDLLDPSTIPHFRPKSPSPTSAGINTTFTNSINNNSNPSLDSAAQFDVQLGVAESTSYGNAVEEDEDGNLIPVVTIFAQNN